MKQIVTIILVFATLIMVNSAAAQTPRLVGTHYAIWDGTQFLHTDSSQLVYLPGNTSPNDANDYRLRTLTCDTLYKRRELPGMGYFDSERESYKFDANGNLTEYLQEVATGPTTNMFRNNVLTYKTYNSNDLITFELILNWNTTNNVWDSASRTTYVYDAKDNIIELTAEIYRNGGWDPSSRRTYMYDANDRRTRYVFERGNITTKMYDSFSKQETVYNANGDHDTTTIYSYDTNLPGFVFQSRYYNQYNASNLDTAVTFQSWTSNMWQNTLLLRNYYDGQGAYTHNDYANWDNTNSIWVNDYRDTVYTTASGKVTIALVKDWDATGNTFVNSTQRTSYLNSFDQLHIETNMSWDNTNGTWVYDAGNDSTIYHYDSTASVGQGLEIAQGTLAIWPNPAQQLLQYNLPNNIPSEYSITILTIDGRIMKQKRTKQAQPVSIADLPVGQYMLLISGSDFRYHAGFTVVH